MRCLFKPTPDMKLTKESAEISAYIFCATNDTKYGVCYVFFHLSFLLAIFPRTIGSVKNEIHSIYYVCYVTSEVLVKMGKTTATRGDMMSLCPETVPKDQVTMYVSCIFPNSQSRAHH